MYPKALRWALHIPEDSNLNPRFRWAASGVRYPPPHPPTSSREIHGHERQPDSAVDGGIT